MAVANPKPRASNPSYPSIGLPEAIERIRHLYHQAHRRRLTREEIARLLGYTGLNGAAVAMVSNLTKYGLLEGRGDSIRISEDGVILALEPAGSSDRAAALQRVAIVPELFRELSAEFEGSPLPPEQAIRIRLGRRGFSPTAAQAASRAFRETWDLVNSEAGEYNQSEAASSEDGQGVNMVPQQPAPVAAGPSVAAPLAVGPVIGADGLPPVSFPLPRGNAIEIRLRQKVTAAEFDQLRQLFDLLRMSIVEEQ